MSLHLNHTPKILIFDSGAGGLSIAQKVLQKIPGAHIVYGADNAFYPYGTKSDTLLTSRIITQVDDWYHSERPDIIVIACNTASTLALDLLRSEIPCPFVGVVPAIKPASNLTKTGVIGVLATPATISRPYTERLIDEFAPNHKVLLSGSDSLVDIAEKKLSTGKVDKAELNNELESLFKQPHGEKIDTVVLACTHFPLIKPEMAELRREGIQWTDSGDAIANRVASLVGDHWQNSETQITFLFTDERSVRKDLTENFHTFLLSPKD